MNNMQDLAEAAAALKHGNEYIGSSVVAEMIRQIKSQMTDDHYLFLRDPNNTTSWVGHGTPWEAVFAMYDIEDVLHLHAVEPEGCLLCQMKNKLKNVLTVHTYDPGIMQDFPYKEGQYLYRTHNAPNTYTVIVDLGDVIGTTEDQEQYLDDHNAVDWYTVTSV